MKRFRILLVIVLAFSLTGCVQKYTATVDQSDAMADYMAGLLLKYDQLYTEGLVTEDDVKAAETDADQTSNSSDSSAIGNESAGSQTESSNNTNLTSTGDNSTGTSGSTSDNASSSKDTSAANSSSSADNTASSDNASTSSDAENKYTTLSDVIGVEGIDITYSGYELADVYPEDTQTVGFSLVPRAGDKLLAVNFTVKNTSNSEKELNLIAGDLSYRLNSNTGYVYNPILTLLENDLQYADIIIGKGKSQTALLVFEVSKDIDMTNMRLIISNNNKSSETEIK